MSPPIDNARFRKTTNSRLLTRAALIGYTSVFSICRRGSACAEGGQSPYSATALQEGGGGDGQNQPLRALRTDPQAAMKDSEARLAGSRRFGAAGRLLVTGQVALSLVLLVAAVMFVKTMVNLRAGLPSRPPPAALPRS